MVDRAACQTVANNHLTLGHNLSLFTMFTGLGGVPRQCHVNYKRPAPMRVPDSFRAELYLLYFSSFEA